MPILFRASAQARSLDCSKQAEGKTRTGTGTIFVRFGDTGISVMNQLLSTYARIAYPILRQELGLQRCIAATRLTIEVLRGLGVTARAQSVTLSAGLTDQNVGVHLGRTVEQIQQDGLTVLPQEFDTQGWAGHLIAVIDSLDGKAYLVDPSFDQVIEKLHPVVSFRWKPRIEIFRIPQASALQCGVYVPGFTNCGQRFFAQYAAKKDKSYRKHPEWEAEKLQPLTERILTGMRRQ
jgi:hypothetical protein